MISPDALISCGFLLLGSSHCIYRLIKLSNAVFFKPVKSQFIIASVGIAAIGGRSFHALVYNLFWRSYPIDPQLIAKELQRTKNDTNVIDWFLRNAGIASLVYSYYHRYGPASIGNLIVVAVTAVEILCLMGDIIRENEIEGENMQVHNFLRRFSAIVNVLPYPIAIFWIISLEFIGRATGNHYCRVANVPFGISLCAFPSQGFYRGLSITGTINDYMMLCYIILMTDGLCQTSFIE